MQGLLFEKGVWRDANHDMIFSIMTEYLTRKT